MITYENEGIITKELHFARLPGDVIVVIFKDKKGVVHAIKTVDILEIVDA